MTQEEPKSNYVNGVRFFCFVKIIAKKHLFMIEVFRGEKMIDEMVDLLDDNGNIIGAQSKKVAHQTGAWHKSIHIYLINHKSEILLQLRTANKDIYPSVWDISVGGHVDAGEETILTACREMEEELGVKSSPEEFTFLSTTKEVLKTGKLISSEFVDSFLIKKNITEQDIKMQECEVADMKFVKLHDFFKMVERKDKLLFPHYEEYSKVLPVLKIFDNTKNI